jgi:outer membrane cobalamin receptor
LRLLSSSVAFSLVLLAHAAADAGPLTGRLVDPGGRVLAGAPVVLVAVDGASIVARTTSTSSGQFAFDAPDSGAFEVRVALEGFRAEPVRVAGERAARDLGTLTLQLSAVSQSVVVSAAQVETPLSSASSSVTVITREDLETHQADSVADALRTVPGLTVSSAGGRGAQTSVFPRGGESDYSLVFIDGVQVNSFGGGYDFGHLPTANVERIEIVRGPQSALYGSNAIGSVIRIVTRKNGAPAASAVIEGGSFDTTRLAAATSGEVNGWSWGGAVERQATDGANGGRAANGQTIANDDYERHMVSAAGGWRRGANAGVRGDIRYTTDERGNPGPYGSDPGGTYGGIDTVARGDNEWLQASLAANATLTRVRLTADVTHARLDNGFVSAFGDSDNWSRRTTGRVLADTTLAPGLEASAGVELLGERAGGTFITATGNALVPVKRGMAGFFGEARWNHGARLFVNAGLRVERITRQSLAGNDGGFPPRPAFPDDTVVSVNPKVSAAWYLTAADGNFTKVRGAAGTGIRPPDAFEMAFTDNSGLKPERSRSADLGVEQTLADGRVLVDATAFFNRFDDLIVSVGRSFAGSSRWRTDNISNARARGVEVSGAWRPIRAFDLKATYTFTSTSILAVDNSSSAPPPYAVGDPLLRRPRHQGSIDAIVSDTRWSAFAQLLMRGETLDAEPAFGPTGGLYWNDGYAITNLGGEWQAMPWLSVHARVLNLFDTSYEEILGYPSPGRTAYAGVRVAASR